MDFTAMWDALAPLGRSATSGGYDRTPFASAERECHAWFVEECARRDLRIESDGNGNTIGWWEPEGARGVVVRDVRPVDAPQRPVERHGLPRPGAVLTGSHLDSVPDGGAYDGPLGVVSALAAVDLMRARGVIPTRRIGVGAFVEEEGSRFGVACLGTRLATGAMSADEAFALRDRDGVAVPDAMAAAGLTPGLGRSAWRDDVATFVELHVEQAATWSSARPRSGWPARSGRTGATASTSPAPPTTPAPPGWRTDTTRC